MLKVVAGISIVETWLKIIIRNRDKRWRKLMN